MLLICSEVFIENMEVELCEDNFLSSSWIAVCLSLDPVTPLFDFNSQSETNVKIILAYSIRKLVIAEYFSGSKCLTWLPYVSIHAALPFCANCFFPGASSVHVHLHPTKPCMQHPHRQLTLLSLLVICVLT